MNTTEIFETMQTMSTSEINSLLRQVKKKAAAKPKAEKKSHVPFSLKINRQRYKMIVTANDVVKHFMEILVSEVGFMTSHAIKSQIISMFEMLAELEDKKALRDKWRQKASNVLMIDSQKHLFSYVTTLATGIKM